MEVIEKDSVIIRHALYLFQFTCGLLIQLSTPGTLIRAPKVVGRGGSFRSWVLVDASQAAAVKLCTSFSVIPQLPVLQNA